MNRPLADEIRPKSLDEVVGQRHLLAPGGVLRRVIESGAEVNMVFYGPSGTGKTTIANIIAQRTNRPLHRLNATTASISDIKDIIADIGTLLALEGVLLTMFDSRTNLAIQVAEEVKRFFPGKVYATVIPRNVRLSEAPSHGKPITAYDRTSRGAEAYTALAEEFLRKNGQSRAN